MWLLEQVFGLVYFIELALIVLNFLLKFLNHLQSLFGMEISAVRFLFLPFKLNFSYLRRKMLFFLKKGVFNGVELRFISPLFLCMGLLESRPVIFDLLKIFPFAWEIVFLIVKQLFPASKGIHLVFPFFHGVSGLTKLSNSVHNFLGVIKMQLFHGKPLLLDLHLEFSVLLSQILTISGKDLGVKGIVLVINLLLCDPEHDFNRPEVDAIIPLVKGLLPILDLI